LWFDTSLNKKKLLFRLGLGEVLARLAKTLSSDEEFMIHYNTYVEEERADCATQEELRKQLSDELEKHRKPKQQGFSYTHEKEAAEADWVVLCRRLEAHSTLKPHLDGIAKVLFFLFVLFVCFFFFLT